MRVLIQWDETKCGMITGWANVLTASGFEIGMMGLENNCFDTFDEFKPDVLIQTQQATRALQRCVGYHPNVKVIDQRNPQPAFDSLRYQPGKFREELYCDISFVGEYSGVTRKLLDRFILPICECGLYNVKLFGNEPWPIPQYLGPINDADIPDLYASSLNNINISADRMGEQAYRILGLGEILVSYHEDGPSDLNVLRFFSLEGFYNRIDQADKSSVPYWEYLQRQVLSNHTYFNRVEEMLRDVGLEQEGDHVAQVRSTCIPSE